MKETKYGKYFLNELPSIYPGTIFDKDDREILQAAYSGGTKRRNAFS